MDFFNDAPPPAAADPTPALEPEPTAGEKRPREDGEGMPGEGMSFADMEQQRRDQSVPPPRSRERERRHVRLV